MYFIYAGGKKNLKYHSLQQNIFLSFASDELRGDYTLLLSNFVLDITFKQIH